MLGVGDGSAMDSFVSSFLHSSTMLRQAIRRARDLEALHELALDLMFEENIALALQISEQEIKPAQPPASEAQVTSSVRMSRIRVRFADCTAREPYTRDGEF